jgi:hypothetical protein
LPWNACGQHETASDGGASRHVPPLESPKAKGFVEQLPLTNLILGELVPTPARLMAAEDGYWLVAGSDLYKLSATGAILKHVVFPYSYASPISLMFWDALAPFSDGRFYALATNVQSYWLPASLFRMDSDGGIKRQWKLDRRLSFSKMLATNDAVFILDYLLLILDHEGHFMHHLDFVEGQNHVGASVLGKDSTERLWVGAIGGKDNIEARLFQINAEGQVGQAYTLRPLITYEMPEHHGTLQAMVPLSDGGWVIAALMAYFKPDNPWEQRWKYLSYLAELGPDRTIRWAQLYQDLSLEGLKRDASGKLWAEGYSLQDGNVIEHVLLMRFSSQGEIEWALERTETAYYDQMLGDQIAVAPDGRLSMGWTREFYQELWFGILSPSGLLQGCATIQPGSLGDRWLGPVEIDVRPVTIEPVELAPIEIWEEPIDLWEGEGEVIDWCPLTVVPPRGDWMSNQAAGTAGPFDSHHSFSPGRR